MVQYANNNFDTYIKEADLIKAVLNKNPVLEYIDPVKTLDNFVKNILNHINQEALLNKVEFPLVVPTEDLKHKYLYIKSSL